MKQRGFTLLEALMVITIAALLLAASLPSAGTWIRNTRIRTAADSISAGLQQARNEAVRRNQPVGFYLVSDANAVSMTDGCALSSTSGSWVISLGSPAGKCQTDRNNFIALRPAGDTSDGLAVAAVDGTATASSSIMFNGFGQVAGAAPITCVRVSNAGDATARSLNIAINPGGQIRMCDPAVSNSNDPRKCLAGCS